MTELSLDAIGLKHRTDKSSLGHDYLTFYDRLFGPIRNAPLTILEIGVLKGASLRMWREYFPNARIVGADIDPFARRFAQPGIEVEYMDQSNLEDLVRVATKYQPFDIIIDDGSHLWEHQTTTLKTLFPFLKQGGIFVIEDLQTNYGDMAKDYRGVATTTCVDFLKRWVDYHIGDTMMPNQNEEDAFLRTYGRGARTIAFYRRMCAIEKRGLAVPPAARESIPLAAPVDHPGRRQVHLIAHVSHIGDAFGPNGYIDLGADMFSFQGFAVEDGDHVLEYRVRGPDGAWGVWTPAPEFAGTRARALRINGVSVRVREAAKSRYDLRALVRFVGVAEPIEAGDGEDCMAPEGGDVRGLQIELTERVES